MLRRKWKNLKENDMTMYVTGNTLCDTCFIHRHGNSLKFDELLEICKRLGDLVQQHTIKDPNSKRCPDCGDLVDTLEVQESYFGSCPECGKAAYFINVGRNHYMVCDTDKVYWCIGSNLMSGWRQENEEIWRANAEHLSGYREVEAAYRRERKSDNEKLLQPGVAPGGEKNVGSKIDLNKLRAEFDKLQAEWSRLSEEEIAENDRSAETLSAEELVAIFSKRSL